MSQLHVEVKGRAVTGLAVWHTDSEGHQVPRYLASSVVENPLINALAYEAVVLFIGGDMPTLSSGFYPATKALTEAVEMYQRITSIGGNLSFGDVCNLLPANELARLWCACEVMSTWINGGAHIHTVASAIATVKTAAARRGLL